MNGGSSRQQAKKRKTRASTNAPAKAAIIPPTPRPRQPVSPRDDLHGLIAKRAYELYSERGYRQGYALDDWLDAEREILSRTSPP
jgi:hypothetical protein